MKKFTMPTYHQAKKIREFGFIPQYTIQNGLRQNIEWYKNVRDAISRESDSLE